MKDGTAIMVLLIFSTSCFINGQKIADYKYDNGRLTPADHAVRSEVQFNGYTNYWHDTYHEVFRYGNLFKMARSHVEKTILQSKLDIAEDMGIPGLIMQEGFMNALLSGTCDILDQPSTDKLEGALSGGDVLVFLDPGSEAGQKVMAELPADREWPRELKSHQYGAAGLIRADLFQLEYGEHMLFVVSSPDAGIRRALGELIENTGRLISKYSLYKGWFGAYTLLNSVTCTKGHPLEVIGTGMNEGNSWFVFDGYMDFLSKNDLEDWMKQVGSSIVTDVGFWPVYGCRDYDGFQVQSMFTKESWNEYARKKGGYVFRRVWDTLADPLHYDGYLATEGNKEQIDHENVPFILRTGTLDQHALNSMVLFIEKDKPLTRESMWDAILDRRATGVLEQGKMMGPALYRNALQMLLLDRVYLEAYFRDYIDLKAVVNGYDLEVRVSNFGKRAAYGDLELTLPAGVMAEDHTTIPVDLPSNSSKTLHFSLQPGKEAMDRTNPVAVHFNMEGRKKSTLAVLDLPPAISVHRLLYGHTPRVSYPVSVHNFSKQSYFPVELQVFRSGDHKRLQFQASKSCSAATGSSQDLLFELDVPPGDYEVKVTALGVETITQLGVGKAEGDPHVYEIDLNSDGINEFRMENDSVQVTLLTTGARVIEYIVKSRHDNVFSKLWPEKPVDDKRPFRKRGYYFYGGFEDFLGQASMETHQVYDAEIVQKEGDYVRVRMWTDYFGNRLEKTFTLYGNSPLLELRYALTFKNQEANIIAPDPLLELGRRHWTEDVFTVPEADGLHEYRMKPERYYGRIFFLKEGWNAGYDTREDVTYVAAYPVDQLLFHHMWMNHPRNPDAHYYCVEFQPWLFIDQMNTTYFTYYIWGTGGPWENGVEALRQRNLITTK
ncbi:MAG: hypothetical protein AMS26_14945 [Bacteroides sp. SM23_62]|nr:MAG: hypothetical protein AMS26_14945 [Bacteroides sp. SM23_62]